jgi:hypothetical protein
MTVRHPAAVAIPITFTSDALHMLRLRCCTCGRRRRCCCQRSATASTHSVANPTAVAPATVIQAVEYSSKVPVAWQR